MNKIDAIIILLVVAVDDVRNALFAVLINADATTLVLLLAVVYYLSKHQDKIAGTTSAFNFDLMAPLRKLKLA